VDNINTGDEVMIDLEKGLITNLTSGETFSARPYPDFMTELIAAGGLIAYTREKIKKETR